MVGGCPNIGNYKGQLCTTHCPKKPCSVDGCPANARARGLCYNHGALGECLRGGCSISARKRGGLCGTHGPKRPCAEGVSGGCSVDGCRGKAYARRLCDYQCRQPCSVDGCPAKADARGLCFKHGSNSECLREGCTSAAQKTGRVCSKHTAKPDLHRARLRHPASPWQVCLHQAWHGAYGYCTTVACSTNATTTRAKCTKHDSKTVACSAEGCSNIALNARGVCDKHGARGPCSVENCTSAAATRGRCHKHGGGIKKKVCNE